MLQFNATVCGANSEHSEHFGIAHGEEIDRVASELVQELHRLEVLGRNKKKRTARPRYVVGLRKVSMFLVTGTPRLVLVSRRVESLDGPNTPLGLLGEVVDLCRKRSIPIAAVLSRKRLGEIVFGTRRCPAYKRPGVTGMMILNEAGGYAQFKQLISLINSFVQAQSII